MKIKKFMLPLLLGFGVSVAGHAAMQPAYLADKRIQVFNYTPNDVFVIRAKVGYSAMIQFADGEIIHDDGLVGMGKAKSWNIGVKGNNVIFKPLEDSPDTNLIVVTNKRTYAFDLRTTGSEDNSTYIARFNYPDDELKDKAKDRPEPVPVKFVEIKQPDGSVFIDAKYNTHYFRRGTDPIAPAYVWDDGLFTFLKYPNANDLPTVYKLMPDGTETLVNTHVKDDVLVIHEVTQTLRLRLGKSVVDIGNGHLMPSDFNFDGTAIEGTKRTEQ